MSDEIESITIRYRGRAEVTIEGRPGMRITVPWQACGQKSEKHHGHDRTPEHTCTLQPDGTWKCDPPAIDV